MLHIIKEMNYQPNLLARQLRTQTTKAVIVIVPIIENSFFSWNLVRNRNRNGTAWISDVDRRLEQPAIPCIDNAATSKALITHLIRLGQRNITHITVSPMQVPYQDRLNSYISVLEKHNISANNNLICYGKPTINGDYDQMRI